MTSYLLSIYQPDGPPPAPEILAPIMRDVRALVEETKAAGIWVFNGTMGGAPNVEKPRSAPTSR